MSDITMCSGKGCDLKHKCHRFSAKVSDLQTYFKEPPIKNGKCDMFWGKFSQQIYIDLEDMLNGKLK